MYGAKRDKSAANQNRPLSGLVYEPIMLASSSDNGLLMDTHLPAI